MIERNPIISNIIAEIVKDAYTKSYRVRSVGPGSLEATIPRVIVEREAKRWGLSIEEFIKLFQVEYLFDDFGGAFLRFKRQPSGDEGKLETQEKMGGVIDVEQRTATRINAHGNSETFTHR